MSTTTTNTLASWDKDNEDYARFQDRILSYSAAKRLDHALLSDPDWIRIHGVQVRQLVMTWPIQDFQEPVFPVGHNDAEPTGTAVTIYSARYKTFHDRKVEALKEIEQVSIFKLAIENALPVRVLQDDINEIGFGTSRRTLSQVFQILNTKFADFPATKLKKNTESLKIPFTGSLEHMDDFIEKQKVAHQTQARYGGGPFPENFKVENFLDCFKDIHQFAGTADAYLRAYPSPATQTFDNVSAEFQIFADTHKLLATTRSEGYASLTDGSDDFIEKVAQAVATKMSSAGNKPVPKKNSSLTAAPFGKAFPHYCWTHGPSNTHCSADCRNPSQGHQTAATNSNRLGGRTIPSPQSWQRRVAAP